VKNLLQKLHARLLFAYFFSTGPAAMNAPMNAPLAKKA